MNLRSVFARIAFILFLLVAQQQAVVHAISHFSPHAASGVSKKQLPSELQCEQCLAFAAIGSALTGSHAHPPLPAAPAIVGVVAPSPAPVIALWRAFNPRAPPLFS